MKRTLIVILLCVISGPMLANARGNNQVLITQVTVIQDQNGTAIGLEIRGNNLCPSDLSNVSIVQFPNAFSSALCSTFGDGDQIDATLNMDLSASSYLLVVDVSKKSKKKSKKSNKNFSSGKIDEFEFTFGMIGEQGIQGDAGQSCEISACSVQGIATITCGASSLQIACIGGGVSSGGGSSNGDCVVVSGGVDCGSGDGTGGVGGAGSGSGGAGSGSTVGGGSGATST